MVDYSWLEGVPQDGVSPGRSEEGVPQSWPGSGQVRMGYPPARSGRGTPLVRSGWGTPDQDRTAEQIHSTLQVVCLLRSRGMTFLFLLFLLMYNVKDKDSTHKDASDQFFHQEDGFNNV